MHPTEAHDLDPEQRFLLEEMSRLIGRFADKVLAEPEEYRETAYADVREIAYRAATEVGSHENEARWVAETTEKATRLFVQSRLARE